MKLKQLESFHSSTYKNTHTHTHVSFLSPFESLNVSASPQLLLGLDQHQENDLPTISKKSLLGFLKYLQSFLKAWLLRGACGRPLDSSRHLSCPADRRQ